MIKRPACWIAFAFSVGICLSHIKWYFWLPPCILGEFLAAVAVFLLKKKDYVFLMCLPIIAVIGVMRVENTAPIQDYGVKEKQLICATGQVTKREAKNGKNLVYLTNVSYETNSKQSAANNILVYLNLNQNYSIGNKIEVKGKAGLFKKPGNKGQFDEYSYRRAEGCDFKIFAETSKLLDNRQKKFSEWLARRRDDFANSFTKILEERDASVLKAMLLGDKSTLQKETKKLYAESGIAHILAISGLHISMIGMTFYGVLRRAGLSYLWSGMVSTAVMLSYGAMTGMGTATLRALVMFTLLLLAKAVGRTYDLLSAAAVSAILILIYNPLLLKQAGFLLSFAAVLGIGLVSPAMVKLLSFEAEGCCAENKKKLASIWTAAKNSIGFCLGIQLSTFPILIYFYYEYPIYSIFLNLILIPLVSFILSAGIFVLAAGIFSIAAGCFFAAPAHYILDFYEWVCMGTQKLPFSIITTGQPELWNIWAYYILLGIGIGFLCYLKNRSIGEQRLLKGSAVICLLLGIIICCLRISEGFEVTFLDVGQGDGIFIKTEEGTTFLIDGGSSDVSNLGEYRLKPFLKASGIGFLDYAMISHMDADHISGLQELLEMDYPIRFLIIPIGSDQDTAGEKMIKLAAEKGTKILYMKKGDQMQEGDLIMKCLHPFKGFQTDDRNDASLVISLSYRKFDLLLTGDLQGDGEKEILKYPQELTDCDILKVAHHGSGFSTPAELLNIIKPEYSILSYGEGNRYGHPNRELVDRLQKVGSNIFKTAEDGAVTVKTDGEKIKLRKYKDIDFQE